MDVTKLIEEALAKAAAEQQKAAGAAAEAEATRRREAEEAKGSVPKGVGVGRFALALMSKRLGERAPDLKSFGFPSHVTKTLQESVFNSGGSAIAPEYSAEFVEYLRPALVMSALGAQQTAFKSEKVIGRVDSGTTAYWVEEGVAPTESSPTTGQLKLKARKLGVYGRVSNDILRNPAAGFDDVNLTRDMIAAAAAEFENQAWNGTGTESKPRGIFAQMASAQSFTKAGTSVANYIADVDKLVNTVDKSDRPRQNRGWVMHPDRELALLGLRDEAGWVFRDEMLERKTLRGIPYMTTTRVSSAKLVHGEFADVVIGIDTAAELSSTDALKFLEDETAFKLILRGDVLLKRSKSFAEINNY